jgi:hypothetical protein
MAAMADERKHRRSTGEKALADAILEKAKKRTPNKEKFKQAATYAENAERADRFELNYGKSSIDGRPIHHFYKIGENLVGVIGEAQGETHGPSSFPFVLDDETVIRVPGNRRLAIAIRKADCLYQRVRITYRGKLHAKTGGHYEKVYLVEAAPLVKERVTPAGRDPLSKAESKQ